MKKAFIVSCALMFAYASVFSQTAAGTSTATPQQLQPPTERKPVSKESLYYGDNIFAHFKQHTGDDLLATYPDFPRFTDTGNLSEDVAGYEKHVFLWIKTHPDFSTKYRINLAGLKN